MLEGLTDLRVIDFSDNIAGSYATRLLADAGAEVIKVEPADGDPMRRWPGDRHPDQSDSALFQFLNTSKKSIAAELDDDAVQSLLGGADLLVNGFAPDTVDVDALAQRFPHLVILSITPWGRAGPYARFPSSEFILQAESGSLSGRGLPQLPPLMAGGRITEWVGGTFAAVAALAAMREAKATGIGGHLDFSLLEVMTIASTTYADLMASLAGRPEPKGPARAVEIPSIEPTKDGWVGFNTNSHQQYSDFLVMIGRTDLLEQKDLANIIGRAKRMDEWNAIVREWTTQRTTAEIVEQAALFRIPVAPVNNGKSVQEHEHFIAREVFIDNPGGGFKQPRPPYRINGELPRLRSPAPDVGEHNSAVDVARTPTAPAVKRDSRLPLAGIRVLDATAWWAGPSSTQMLAHLGAEVIHLEAIQRLDGMRMMGGHFISKPQWWEYSAMFLGANTNKLGLTVNLDHPQGVAVVKDLLQHCDVFVENYSPRVIEKFGLDWDAVHAVNDQTIMVRMPAFGLDGPWRDHVGFAQTMEQITGMAWITGFPDDQPRIQRGPCDPLAGMHAAFAALVALEERERTGLGSFCECPMVEGALNASAEQIVEYSAYGTIQQRMGNRCVTAAPQGLYACRGHCPENEQWLALSVETDEQWQDLLRCLDNPAELDVEEFETRAQRLTSHDTIDAALSEFFSECDVDETVQRLRTFGVPAGEVWRGTHMSTHPQHIARKFYEVLDHPIVGSHPYVTTPFRSKHVAIWLRSPAPTVGEHNVHVLRGILGYTDERIEELETLEIIGRDPAGLS